MVRMPTATKMAGRADEVVTVPNLEEARPFVRALARSLVRQRDDLDDVVQEALVRAHCRLPQLRHSESFWAWLGCVTRTVCLNWERHARRSRVAEPETAPPRVDPTARTEEEALGRAVLADLTDLVRLLPAHYAEPMMLLVTDGMSYRAIAATLAVPLGTVKARLHRARRMLLSGSSGALVRAALAEHDSFTCAA